MTNDEVWRWNANLAWELFSSAIYNYRLSLNESKEHKQHAYYKNIFLNMVSAIEAYCNETLIKDKRWSKSKIREKYLSEKLLELGITDDAETFKNSKFIRNNLIVHHKRHDYTYFEEINDNNALAAIESSQDIIAEICFNKKTIFPYWITGLNFINPLQGNDIFLLDDHQFWKDLKVLQVSKTIHDMVDATGAIYLPKDRKTYNSLYKEIWNELKNRGFKLDILKNLKTSKYPHKPLLTSEWWSNF